MAGDYTKQAEAALRLIAAKGQPISFLRDGTAVDPVTGGIADPDAPSYTEWGGHGVRLPSYKGPQFEAMDAAFKTALVVGKAAVILLAAHGMPVAPEPGDNVILGDATVWSVIGVTTLNPAGQPILYTLGVLLK